MLEAKAWCDSVAELAADALLDAGLIGRSDIQRVVAIVSEEIEIRLILGDCPAPVSRQNES